jgi:hypothetical protein
MGRVCRTGGIVMLSLECTPDGTPPAGGPLSAGQVRDVIASQPALAPVQPVNWTATQDTWKHVRTVDQVIADLGHGHTEYPHIVLEQDGCRFTSLSLFLRKGRVDA